MITLIINKSFSQVAILSFSDWGSQALFLQLLLLLRSSNESGPLQCELSMYNLFTHTQTGLQLLLCLTTKSNTLTKITRTADTFDSKKRFFFQLGYTMLL